MTNNTQPQLPDEVAKEIKEAAKAYTTVEVKGMVDGSDINPGHIKYAFEAGATEYAIKLHTARTILKKAYDLNLMPSTAPIIEQIKQFLDGK